MYVYFYMVILVHIVYIYIFCSLYKNIQYDYLLLLIIYGKEEVYPLHYTDLGS